jgi:hypothetical protein
VWRKPCCAFLLFEAKDFFAGWLTLGANPLEFLSSNTHRWQKAYEHSNFLSVSDYPVRRVALAGFSDAGLRAKPIGLALVFERDGIASGFRPM